MNAQIKLSILYAKLLHSGVIDESITEEYFIGVFIEAMQQCGLRFLNYQTPKDIREEQNA
jgi:hypothetical protein